MKPQIIYKNNNNGRNIQRAAYILYLLKINNISQQKIADDLKISNAAVSRSIYGLSKVTNVENWLRNKLGVSFDE